MRRISLALALLGAVAAAGCGGNKAPSANGGSKGVGNQTFTVTVQNGQGGNASLAIVGGNVTSSPAGINCGVGITGTAACSATFAAGTTVVLTATPVGTDAAYALPYQFLGWAGDCQGDQGCSLSGNSDKYIVVTFAGQRTGHANFSAPSVHGKAYLDLQLGVAGALDCTQCHGANLQGRGIALSCATCHSWPLGAHFDTTAAAYGTHNGSGWSQSCQRCHTDQGFRDYVGELAAPGEAAPSADYLAGTFMSTNPLVSTGSASATVDSYAYGPQQCRTCHNTVSDPRPGGLSATGLTQVMFPSGYVATTDNVTALCAQCHEARESTVSMNTLIGAVAADAQINAVSGVSFKNPHYRGAAATLYGSLAQGWAQYPSKVYTGQNLHGGQASCTVCHAAHTGEVSVTAATCGKCHFKADGTPIASMDDLKNNRQFGFAGDIDGDGVVAPLDVEIAGLKTKLLAAIQAYAVNVAGQPGICFDDATYPYFLKHTGTGACTAAELATPVAFKAFTPRLMRAAYNLKFASTEFGAWAHNPRYAIEVLFDAITDLNAGLGVNAVPFSGFRAFADGHFGGATAAKPAGADAFSHWPPPNNFTGTNAACAQCHSGQVGNMEYVANLNANGAPLTTSAATPVNAFQCTTCHAPQAGDTNFKSMRSDILTIAFPPAKAATNNPVVVPASTFPAAKDKVCATCHTGRENMTTVDLAIGVKIPGDFTVAFKNPHYLGAAGMIMGSNAHMLYEYPGQAYAAYPVFYGAGSTNGAAPGPYGSPHGSSCTGCHNPQGSKHSFEIDLATTVPAAPFPGYLFRGATYGACDGCHAIAATGDHRLEPVKANVAALAAQLLTEINAYQVAGGQSPICYNGGLYPYWYVGSVHPGGLCDATETVGYGAKFDAKTAKATYNFQWSQKEPGAFAHNYDYIAQGLIDAIRDLDPAGAAAVLPCDAHDTTCVPGVPYTGTAFITRP